MSSVTEASAPPASTRRGSLEIAEQGGSQAGQAIPLRPATHFIEHIGGAATTDRNAPTGIAEPSNVRNFRYGSPLSVAEPAIAREGPLRSDTLPSYFSERLPSYALAVTGMRRSPLRTQTQTQIDDPSSKCRKLMMWGIGEPSSQSLDRWD